MIRVMRSLPRGKEDCAIEVDDKTTIGHGSSFEGMKAQIRQVRGMGRHNIRYDIPEGAGISWKQNWSAAESPDHRVGQLLPEQWRYADRQGRGNERWDEEESIAARSS
jgi:hypothetical protein